MGGGSHDVAVGERVCRLPRGDEARDVGHVRHQVGAFLIRDLLFFYWLGLVGWDWLVGIGWLGLIGWDWLVGIGRLGLIGWDW